MSDRPIIKVQSTDEFLARLRDLKNGDYISYQVNQRTSLFKFQEIQGNTHVFHYTYTPGTVYPLNIFDDLKELVNQIRQSKPNITITDVSKNAREDAVRAARGDFSALANIDNSLPAVLAQIETSAKAALAPTAKPVSASPAILGFFGGSTEKAAAAKQANVTNPVSITPARPNNKN